VLLVGAAGADSTISFSDPPGDGGSSTDITALEISSSPGFPGFSGGVGFWATVKPDSSWCRSEGGDVPLLVAVDTDQNPDTGSAFYGTEVEFAFEPSGQGTSGRRDVPARQRLGVPPSSVSGRLRLGVRA
jgi:hypothetical protein